MRSQIQLMRTASLTVLVALVVLLPTAPADASIIGLSELHIDFTKPADAKSKARWEDTDRFGCSKTGFGWKGTKVGSRAVDLHITEPLALGTWWRPTTVASIKARVTWAGKHATSTRHELFVRHSPDAQHWSAWTVVGAIRNKKPAATYEYRTELRIRRASSDWYRRKLREYAKKDVPWTSDEEAAVTWMLEKHPDLFARSKPFLGYVQFLYEVEIPPETTITSLEVDVTWVVSGVSSIPKDPSVGKRREDQPWRYKATAVDEAAAAATRAVEEKAIYEVALKYAVDHRADFGLGGHESSTQIVLYEWTEAPTRLLTLPIKKARAYYKAVAALDRTMVEDFAQRTRFRTRVPTSLQPGHDLVYLTTARYWLLRRTFGEKHQWEGHYKSWPNSCGRFGVSGIGISEDGRQALVHVSQVPGDLATRAHLFRLEKRDGAWHVAALTMTYMN